MKTAGIKTEEERLREKVHRLELCSSKDIYSITEREHAKRVLENTYDMHRTTWEECLKIYKERKWSDEEIEVFKTLHNKLIVDVLAEYVELGGDILELLKRPVKKRDYKPLKNYLNPKPTYKPPKYYFENFWKSLWDRIEKKVKNI